MADRKPADDRPDDAIDWNQVFQFDDKGNPIPPTQAPTSAPTPKPKKPVITVPKWDGKALASLSRPAARALAEAKAAAGKPTAAPTAKPAATKPTPTDGPPEGYDDYRALKFLRDMGRNLTQSQEAFLSSFESANNLRPSSGATIPAPMAASMKTPLPTPAQTPAAPVATPTPLPPSPPPQAQPQPMAPLQTLAPPAPRPQVQTAMPIYPPEPIRMGNVPTPAQSFMGPPPPLTPRPATGPPTPGSGWNTPLPGPSVFRGSTQASAQSGIPGAMTTIYSPFAPAPAVQAMPKTPLPAPPAMPQTSAFPAAPVSQPYSGFGVPLHVRQTIGPMGASIPGMGTAGGPTALGIDPFGPGGPAGRLVAKLLDGMRELGRKMDEVARRLPAARGGASPAQQGSQVPGLSPEASESFGNWAASFGGILRRRGGG